MKKRPKIKFKSSGEWDALTSAKKFYCYLTKPGISKRIKRIYNKRFRKLGKDECVS